MSNFYLIGTKYGDHNTDDITPYLLEKQAIALGFFWHTDLSKFYNSDITKLDKLFRDKGEKPSSIGQIKRFLSLKPGDLVALKSTGNPNGKTPRLEIIGYAVVVKRNGIVYRHDPDHFPKGLGHLINVDFLEFDIQKTLQLGGYAQSIYKFEDKSLIDLIFGSYSNVIPSQRIQSSSGTKRKDIADKLITINSSYIRRKIHNKIQQGICNLWVTTYGEDVVKMEKDYVDIILTINNSIELVEVKPYDSATYCIREGLGQLLNYYHRHYSNRQNVSLTIIGSKEPNSDDKKFIKFIQTSLNLKFRYDSWERLNLKK